MRKQLIFTILLCSITVLGVAKQHSYAVESSLLQGSLLVAANSQSTSTVVPFSFGGNAASPEKAQEPAKTPATTPVKQEASTPPPADSIDTPTEKTKESSVTVVSFAVPMPPTATTPGRAVMVPTTQDIMGLTSFTPDSVPDSCIKAIAVGTSPLTAVRLESFKGVQASWKTKNVKLQAKGILAVQQEEKLLNKDDADFSLDVAQPTTLHICVQDDGAISRKDTLLRIIFFHADGSRTYSAVAK